MTDDSLSSAVCTIGDEELLSSGQVSKDDIFIACAMEGEADYLVSGDADLLDLVSYQGVQIIPPNAFLQILDAIEL